MKKITRILCLVLCLATLAPGLVSCTSSDTQSGAQINMYLADEVYNLDPAYAHLDSSATKLVGLLFEGIMKLDDDGDVVKALCKSWSYTEDEGVDKESDADNKYTMEIKLKDSGWSDGRAVAASEFVYAWKRLLDPDFNGEGAELLFDIKGAWECKNEGKSPDDVGLYYDKTILTIEFKHSIDPDDFLRKLTSVALFPLREDALRNPHWSSANTTIVTNGPFTLLSYFPGDSMELGRNTYFRHDTTDDEAPTPSKYVKPYKIMIDFKLNEEEMLQSYEDGELFYISELPVSQEIREQYLKKADVYDTLSSHVYYFNTNVEPFNNPAVRQVLSAVISRQEIANRIVFAKPSTGFIPEGVTDLKKKDDFAENNQNKIVTDAISVSEAKSKLQAAGINPSDYSFKLTVKVNSDSVVNEAQGSLSIRPVANSNKRIYETVDYVVAEMVVAKWKELGFNVEINAVNADSYQESKTQLWQYRDVAADSLYGTEYVKFLRNEEKGNQLIAITEDVKIDRASFDVIALDYQMLDTTAFSALSVFASEYSGAALDENFKTLGHVTGYNSEAYNKLIAEADEARIAGNKTVMSEKLHEAEKLLLEDCPVMPIFVYQEAIISSGDLSRFGRSGWGFPEFNKIKLKNWEDYLPDAGEKDEE